MSAESLPAFPRTEPGRYSRRHRAVVPRRVLLVEDNTILAYAFALELRLDGHEVHVAPNGLAALAQAPAFRPEVVLLDLGLPDMHGHEVARRLREITAPDHPLIIALTGHAQEQHRQSSKEAGCDHHLVKPVEADVLRAVLETLDTAGGGPAAG